MSTIEAVSGLIKQWQGKSSEPVCAYIYDLHGMEHHVRTMLAAMPVPTRLFYAIKANPDIRIIQSLLPLVHGFEVASIGELLKVREVSAAVPILFGGPGKKHEELELAIRHNVLYFHVESLLELRRLISLSKELDRPVSILLRINLRTNELPVTKITMGGRPSPFGLDEQLIGEAIDILREEAATGVSLRGFHFHSLSNNLDAALHVEMVRLYAQKVGEWKREYGLDDIEIINCGGGFGVSYDEREGFDWQLFTSLLAESGVTEQLENMQLLFEPGRFIVADYGYYAAEVVDLKQSHDQWFAVLRGGTHHNRLPASWGHNHPFRVVSSERWPYRFTRPGIENGVVTIVGELCSPKDRMHTDAAVSRLRVGDVVVFEKSGAYCWTISHHDFLGHPHPKFHYLMEGEGSGDESIRYTVQEQAR